MKRIFPVLLGALAGAIGLPIVIWLYALFVHRIVNSLAPNFLGGGPLSFKFYIGFFYASIDGVIIIATGATLGAWNVSLLRQRTLWRNVGCAACSAIALLYFVWGLAGLYQLGATTPNFVHTYFLPIIIFRSPILLWALALFFFAVLSRPRKPLLP